MEDPELSRFQGELLLRLVRQGPVSDREVQWQSVNALRRYGLIRVTGGMISYTTEGFLVAVGLSLRGTEMGRPWRKAS